MPWKHHFTAMHPSSFCNSINVAHKWITIGIYMNVHLYQGQMMSRHAILPSKNLTVMPNIWHVLFFCSHLNLLPQNLALREYVSQLMRCPICSE